ncbi:MAG: hypothetical protein D6756_01170 [Cyanobacteria bacterium J083]|nr:MAG: hypothetical protein D6756_01170 [Cyanobacteria bacterium J083]
MTQKYTAEKTISAVFQTEKQVDRVIRRLLDSGVDRDHISVMGRNFESQTRISGFISKKDVIIGGLRSGAIFGSLFGSFLSLLTGVGVLFIPFIGAVVAAGPISSVLLGAATGAIAGSAGAGLASALVTLGMPEDKAAVYETRLKAGEFLLMVEVPADKVTECQQLIQSEGGEEVHINEATLPHPCPGLCNSVEDLSPEIRSHLSPAAQEDFIKKYNEVFKQTNDQIKAEEQAWLAIKEKYDEDKNGVFSQVKLTT